MRIEQRTPNTFITNNQEVAGMDHQLKCVLSTAAYPVTERCVLIEISSQVVCSTQTGDVFILFVEQTELAVFIIQ